MTQEKTKYCHQCGAMIPYIDRYCPACNAAQQTLPGMITEQGEKKGKSPWIAVILSFLVTGLGQYYLGERRRGIAFFGGTLIVGLVLAIWLTQDQIMSFGVIMALISAIDAYQIGTKRKQI